MLSANSEASINLEYLMEDIDFSELLKREQFEALIQPILNKIETNL